MTQLFHNFSDFIFRYRRNHVSRSGSVVRVLFETLLNFVAAISMIRFFACDDHVRTESRQVRIRGSSRVVDNLVSIVRDIHAQTRFHLGETRAL